MEAETTRAERADSRLEGLPDLRAVGGIVLGYEVGGWYDVVAPKNTPTEIVDMLNKDISEVLADPKLEARFAHLCAAALRAFGRRSRAGTRSANRSRPQQNALTAHWFHGQGPLTDEPSRQGAARRTAVRETNLADHGRQ
jgi:hypothetical protein